MDEKIEEMAEGIESELKVYFGAGDVVAPEDFPYQARGIAESLAKKGYRKESDTVKEVLQKVLKFTLDDEVGMRYLVKNLAKEYGVELKQEKKYDSVKKKISRA